MEISHVLLRCCLQVNSIIVCENERIPQRARESAFLGIVHFAHCQKLLACQGSLKRKCVSGQNTKCETERDRIIVMEICCRHCESVFWLCNII